MAQPETPRNRAAYLTRPKEYPFAVKEAAYPAAKSGEVVVRVHAAAINPIDWAIQRMGTRFMFSWLKYPAVMGQDLAGTVTAVGPEVTRFKIGDRILAHAVGTDKRRNRPEEGAFQKYAVALEHLAAPIPDGMSFEHAAVVPLGASTAACGLYMRDYLALRHPSAAAEPEATARSTGQTVLIWGGSTSVGCNAIQLAVASGYEVVTTCSPRNFALVKRLGAAEAFDYNSKTVTADIVAAFAGKTCAGAFAIGSTGAEGCFAVLSRLSGKGNNRFIAFASYPLPMKPMSLGTVAMFMYWQVSWWVRGKTQGVKSKFIFGSDLVENEVGPALYEKFLPQALADGTYVPAPEPEVVGEGVEEIQAACDMQMQGVSAKKLVVRL